MRGKNMVRFSGFIIALCLMFPLPQAMAEDSPQEQRHELMEDSKNAAKTVGGMLKGEVGFDAESAMESFMAWQAIGGQFGDLFPAGTETGHDTEARPTVWTDRAGFDEELSKFNAAVDAAIKANPTSLAELKPAAGPIFKSCKSCHEGYRVEEED
jgi:cytochrome c556